MKSIINYYYNFNISNLRYINSNYYFNFNNNNYIFYNVNDLYINYDLINTLFLNNNLHTIILNINNDIVTTDGKNKFVLLKVNIKSNRDINISDIIHFNVNFYDNKKIIPYNWNDKWSKKIDYLEYYISKRENLSDGVIVCLLYFIGMGENALGYFNKISNYNSKVTVVHKRISNINTLYDLYNPLNLIIDYRERDIAEYLKSLFMNDKYNSKILCSIINKLNPNIYNYNLIFCRLLFPTFFFDIFDNTILKKIDDNEIISIYDKILQYERFLHYIYILMSKKANMFNVLWLGKD